MHNYNGMVSSDWSQCLSPSGPFDPLIYLYPDLRPELSLIFKQYTGNEITLGHAIDQVNAMLPGWPSYDQLDLYLEACFETYAGVPELIRWCRRNGILFMVNTTGFAAYFQRVLTKGLLPPIDVLSAQSKWHFGSGQTAPIHQADLKEVEDKAHNSAAIAKKFSIPNNKIVLMGDSGGDGPHFEWGATIGATLIGSMTKPSLRKFCSDRQISIHHQTGHTYQSGESISIDKESRYDFRSVIDILATAIGINHQQA